MHQGIIARAAKPCRQYQENDPPDRSHYTIAFADPRWRHRDNLGACLRSADAAGVHAVSKAESIAPAQLNATAKKAARGAAESVPLIRRHQPGARTMRMLQEENI